MPSSTFTSLLLVLCPFVALSLLSSFTCAGEAEHQQVAAVLSPYAQTQLSELCEHFPEMELCQEVAVAAGQEVQKRKSAYMRFGRSSGGPMDKEKRKSAYMRFGKRAAPQLMALDDGAELLGGMEKRKSAYMRFGKRKSAYMRFGRK